MYGDDLIEGKFWWFRLWW